MDKKINVLFFASIREQTGKSRLRLSVPDEIDSIARLIEYIAGLGPGFFGLGGEQTVLTSRNQEVVKPGEAFADGDEIAFFPPVTGG